MKVSISQLRRIIREEFAGKDTLSRTHRGGHGEMADPRLDYDDDFDPNDPDGDGREDIVEARSSTRRLLIEEKGKDLDEAEVAGNPDHLYPRVDWKVIEELTDKWIKMEEDAWDKGDPSMNPDSESDRDAKSYWDDQVEGAAMDMEAEMTLRIRRVALQTMQEFSEKLVNGEYT